MSHRHAVLTLETADICVNCWHTRSEHTHLCGVEGCTGPCSQFALTRASKEEMVAKAEIERMPYEDLEKLYSPELIKYMEDKMRAMFIHRLWTEQPMEEHINPHRDEIVEKVSKILLKELYDLPTQAAKEDARQLAREIYDELFGAIPEYDNHHNALLCPYCNRRRDEEERKIRADAFEDAAVEMDRLVEVMKEQHERITTQSSRNWASSYIADREAHAVWLRKWAEKERNKE